MQPSLKTLLTGAVDYAGLFPPAALALDPAVRNYASYLKSPDRWMLGRFICPAARLSELLAYLDELFKGKPISIAALQRPGRDVSELAAGLAEDLKAIDTFRNAAGQRAIVDVLEGRCPADFLPAGELVPLIGTAGRLGMTPWCELVAPPGAEVMYDPIFIHFRNNKVGLKVRCGGTEASAFPSCGLLAELITLAAGHGVPIKFTAGLHHPIRTYHESVKTQMHGFVNVYVASVVSRSLAVSSRDIEKILESTTASDFVVNDSHIGWKDYLVPLAQVQAVRPSLIGTFGSCSFDEPREDLAALGWM